MRGLIFTRLTFFDKSLIFMVAMKSKRIIFSLGLFIQLCSVSCYYPTAKEENEIAQTTYPFKWVKNAAWMQYDYYSLTDTVHNAFSMNIEGADSLSYLIFNFGNSAYKPRFTLRGRLKVYKRKDGLYSSSCPSCGFGPCFALNYAMRIPSKPVLNKIYPEYLCEDKVWFGLKVVSVNHEITTSLGTFKTIVLQDTASLSKEYWSEQSGLIRLEDMNEDGTLQARWDLSTKNY